MNYKLLTDTAMLAGEIMLSSGAETYRVEDTMYHILKTSDSDSIEAMALLTGIMITVNDERMTQPISMVKRVNRRNTNMNNVIKVNDISRRYCGGQITLEEAYKSLKNVKEKQYNRIMYNVATIGIVSSFALVFGGTWLDVVAAAFVGMVLACMITLGKIIKLNGILVHVICGIMIAMTAMGMQRFLLTDIDSNIVIISSLMPIVPGVAITNAVRDTLQGDYLSGGARVLEAFLVAASIAVGVGLGMILFSIVAGGSAL